MLAWQTAFFLGAVVVLVLMSFWSLENFRIVHHYILGNWKDVFSSSLFRSVYVHTIWYTGLSAVVGVLLAFPFAYGLAFHVPPAVRRVALLLLIIPFFTSYLIRSYSWTFILADGGLLNRFLGLFGLRHFAFQGSLLSLQIGYLTYFFPLVTLVILLSLMNVDRSLIEAANNLGAGRVRSVLTVVLPSARIGLVFGFAFGFMLALGDYIAPTFGGSGKRTTLSVLVVDATKAGGDFPRAAAIAVIMVITLLAVLFAAFAFAFPRRRRV
ncbi:MAG: ABC transporter permease [Thermoleophilia bacterium]